MVTRWEVGKIIWLKLKQWKDYTLRTQMSQSIQDLFGSKTQNEAWRRKIALSFSNQQQQLTTTTTTFKRKEKPCVIFFGNRAIPLQFWNQAIHLRTCREKQLCRGYSVPYKRFAPINKFASKFSGLLYFSMLENPPFCLFNSNKLAGLFCIVYSPLTAGTRDV